MDKLACRIMPGDPQALVLGTFPCDVAEWAFVRGGLSVSHGYFAVIKLVVYEFLEGGALFRIGFELFVNGSAYRL